MIRIGVKYLAKKKKLKNKNFSAHLLHSAMSIRQALHSRAPGPGMPGSAALDGRA
jgi:hypothetical protein